METPFQKYTAVREKIVAVIKDIEDSMNQWRPISEHKHLKVLENLLHGGLVIVTENNFFQLEVYLGRGRIQDVGNYYPHVRIVFESDTYEDADPMENPLFKFPIMEVDLSVFDTYRSLQNAMRAKSAARAITELMAFAARAPEDARL